MTGLVTEMAMDIASGRMRHDRVRGTVAVGETSRVGPRPWSATWSTGTVDVGGRAARPRRS